jgi:hypothetical protein
MPLLMLCDALHRQQSRPRKLHAMFIVPPLFALPTTVQAMICPTEESPVSVFTRHPACQFAHRLPSIGLYLDEFNISIGTGV